eukprot:jgi/Ulvmu1/4631/UM002_0362.1
MERIGSVGLNSALIQESTPVQETGNGGIHRKPMEFGKAGAPGGGGAIWARGAADRDPLFPEPGVGSSKAFNSGAARWGANDTKKWAGVRPGEGERRAVQPAAGVPGGARRWDESRAPARAAGWVNDANESENWRGARAAPRSNDVPWRKGDGKREGAGALPNGTFGGPQNVLPGARAGAGLRPPNANRAAAGGGTKYSKADLMDVFHKLRDEEGNEISPPDDVIDAADFRDIWRPLAERHVNNEQAHVSAPPGLDNYRMLKNQLEQISKHFMGLSIRFPLQALQLDQYYYKDPAGNIQGPFPSLNLKSWNDQGWLYDELECQSAASRDTFFSFATLKSLWEVGDRLRLQPAELERLADAEARFGSLLMEEHIHAEDMQQEMLAAAHGGNAGIVPAVNGENGMNHVEQQMEAVRLGNDREHARVQNWLGTVPEKPVDMHAADHGQTIPYADLAPVPGEPEPSYDPIDDIIDDPNAQTHAIDPRDGDRVLQPFGGMGPGVVAADPVAAVPQSGPAQQSAMPSQHVQQDQPQHQSARMLAADPILNIPVHVVPAPAATERGALPPTEAVSGGQHISPYDLFTSKQPEARAPSQPGLQPAAPVEIQTDAPPVYAPSSRPAAADAASVAQGARRWGNAPTPQQTGVPLAAIQREELEKRQQEEVAAQAVAQANAVQEQQERERRAAWTAQPQPVTLRQIMDDEECAADMEGGYDAGKDDYVPQGYNPWQCQSALPQEAHDVHADGNDNAQDFCQPPAQPAARAAVATRTAAQIVGKEQPKSQPRQAIAVPSGTGRPAAWQAASNRPAAVIEKQPPAAAPALQPRGAITGEPEPEVFRNSPDFREWCVKEMERLQGNENVLVVLLETGANCEIMEIARSNLKGDNIGAFVAEFIKRKAQAQVARAPGRRRRRGGAAAAPAAAPAPAPSRADTVADVGAGDGFVSVAGKGRAARRKGAQPAVAAQNARAAGNTFAMLPSM